MKTVKVKFVGKWEGIQPENNTVCYWLMKNGYDVQVTDDPDYIICDVFGNPSYAYCDYPQIRILETGENYTPDFNVVDYAICRYPIRFQDRNFYQPGCSNPADHWYALANEKTKAHIQELFENKQYFADFIFSHDSEYEMRSKFFEKMNAYKRVESCGTFLNNMPGNAVVDWTNNSKTEFQSRCKFTICFESTSHNGFTTEKITDAFFAGSIPIYYGNPQITEIFNKDAFINCHDFENLDAVMERVMELDRDDEKYLEMLSQPILVDPEYPARLDRDLERFILSIFEQPLESAYRRCRAYYPKWHDERLARMVEPDRLYKIKTRIKECFFNRK